ncbi:hypothetical protein Q5752_001500 [Cryptotrichosporon argae]
MHEIQAADTTFATIGAVLWSVQVIPQIIKSYRTKSTDGLSPWLMFIWQWACAFQASYLVAQRSSIPLQVQPQCFALFGSISWAQTLLYGARLSLLKTAVCWAALVTVAAGFEAGSVFALWKGEDNGTEAPLLAYGWIASALLVAGLLPEYWEIYKHKEVVGISLTFIAVDTLGGVFSFLSLFFRDEFDYTAFVQYALVVVCDSIVLVLAAILNPRARRRRALLAADAEADAGAGAAAAAEGDPERLPGAENEGAAAGLHGLQDREKRSMGERSETQATVVGGEAAKDVEDEAEAVEIGDRKSGGQ